jgi:hypothetical protein
MYKADQLFQMKPIMHKTKISTPTNQEVKNLNR